MTEAEPIQPEPAGDEKILIPHREVRLTNGKHYLVAPWGLTKGKLVLERLDKLTPKMVRGTAEARQVLAVAWDEMIELITMTLEIDRAEMEKDPLDGGWTFEDVLEVTEAILEVCILRSDGRGALPFLLAVTTRMNEVTLRAFGPEFARRLSSVSGPADTSPPPSRNGSGSRRPKKRGRH